MTSIITCTCLAGLKVNICGISCGSSNGNRSFKKAVDKTIVLLKVLEVYCFSKLLPETYQIVLKIIFMCGRVLCFNKKDVMIIFKKTFFWSCSCISWYKISELKKISHFMISYLRSPTAFKVPDVSRSLLVFSILLALIEKNKCML